MEKILGKIRGAAGAQGLRLLLLSVIAHTFALWTLSLELKPIPVAAIVVFAPFVVFGGSNLWSKIAQPKTGWGSPIGTWAWAGNCMAIIAGYVLGFLAGLLIAGLLPPFQRIEPSRAFTSRCAQAEIATLSDGLRIRYWWHEPENRRGNEALAYLHGGPGGYTTTDAVLYFGSLTRLGVPVLLFDQVGGGCSDRLPRLADYSVDLSVAQLHEFLTIVKEEHGIDSFVLASASWGATLAGHYYLHYPGLDYRYLFLAPGPLGGPLNPTRQRQVDILTAKSILLTFTPVSWHKWLITQKEAIALDQFLDSRPGARSVYTCRPGELQAPEYGSNMVMRLTLLDELAVFDLEKVFPEGAVPPLGERGRVIVGSPECEFIPHSAATSYIEVFRLEEKDDEDEEYKEAEPRVIQGAGHNLVYDAPCELTVVILDFLLDMGHDILRDIPTAAAPGALAFVRLTVLNTQSPA